MLRTVHILVWSLKNPLWNPPTASLESFQALESDARSPLMNQRRCLYSLLNSYILVFRSSSCGPQIQRALLAHYYSLISEGDLEVSSSAALFNIRAFTPWLNVLIHTLYFNDHELLPNDSGWVHAGRISANNTSCCTQMWNRIIDKTTGSHCWQPAIRLEFHIVFWLKFG